MMQHLSTRLQKRIQISAHSKLFGDDKSLEAEGACSFANKPDSGFSDFVNGDMARSRSRSWERPRGWKAYPRRKKARRVYHSCAESLAGKSLWLSIRILGLRGRRLRTHTFGDSGSESRKLATGFKEKPLNKQLILQNARPNVFGKVPNLQRQFAPFAASLRKSGKQAFLPRPRTPPCILRCDAVEMWLFAQNTVVALLCDGCKERN